MKRYLLCFFIVLIIVQCSAQSKKKFGTATVDGHLEYLENVWIQPDLKEWITMGTIKNRINFHWYMSNSFTANVGMRNILNYGSMVYNYYPYLTEYSVKDYGLMDLTFKWASDSSYFFYTNFDRANLAYNHGKFEIVAGRQRINWGVNLVWTPNDIFNTFSYFDFDYVERPGCDAIRFQYYSSNTSSVQLACKIDSDDKSTIAAMYKFNKWNYDFQVLGGVMEDDIVLGGGWAGQIKGAGFNGEFSYFRSKDNFSDSLGIFIVSAGANYTFSSSLYLHASVIYNTNGTTGKAYLGNYIEASRDISVKTLTPARYELFGEASYKITPLIKADIAGIVNPNDGSFFVGPSLDFSLTENLDLYVIAQLFFGEEKTEYGDYGKLIFGRLKWSF